MDIQVDGRSMQPMDPIHIGAQLNALANQRNAAANEAVQLAAAIAVRDDAIAKLRAEIQALKKALSEAECTKPSAIPPAKTLLTKSVRPR